MKKPGQTMTTKAMAAGIMTMNHGTQKVTNMDGATKKDTDAPTQLNGKHRVTNGKDGASKTRGRTPGVSIRKQKTSVGKLLNQQKDNLCGLKKITKEQEKEGNRIPKGRLQKTRKPSERKSTLRSLRRSPPTSSCNS